ncbi:hypothetical protein AALP_AAs39296U000100 [Arabis alpina]|uniref:Uncharacterized protein n=1 Tax=Arabis alpina TaxID=50452 RepID=A0A087G3X9_ARAAL|nr:hypothetical protein AALP_AAs39296U000100 [Arabis alpina]
MEHQHVTERFQSEPDRLVGGAAAIGRTEQAPTNHVETDVVFMTSGLCPDVPLSLCSKPDVPMFCEVVTRLVVADDIRTLGDATRPEGPDYLRSSIIATKPTSNDDPRTFLVTPPLTRTHEVASGFVCLDVNNDPKRSSSSALMRLAQDKDSTSFVIGGDGLVLSGLAGTTGVQSEVLENLSFLDDKDLELPSSSSSFDSRASSVESDDEDLLVEVEQTKKAKRKQKVKVRLDPPRILIQMTIRFRLKLDIRVENLP